MFAIAAYGSTDKEGRKKITDMLLKDDKKRVLTPEEEREALLNLKNALK